MNNVRQVGVWSAVLATIFAVGYCVPQILSALKLIPHPQDLYWLFTPSLFLAPAFLVTMICLDFAVSPGKKIWTTIGWVFAAIYCSLITIVYFTQLTVVLPEQMRNSDIGNKNVLLFDRRTFLMAIDCLGYFFMSLSTLFASNAFAADKQNRWLYRGLFWNGALLPILILAFFYPAFYYAGALWMIYFPMAMINAAKYFTRSALLNNETTRPFRTRNLDYVSDPGTIN